MKIETDKIIHLLAGALVALVTLLVTRSNLTAIVMATIAGAAKEWWDSRGYGNVEFADFLATVVGGILAIGGVTLWSIISHWI